MLWQHDEQVYPDVNHLLAEGLLKLEPAKNEAARIRKIASDLLREKYRFPGWQRCALVAPLLVLRFGDRRSLPLLNRHVTNLDKTPHPAIAKAALAVYVSYGIEEYRVAEAEASLLRDNYLAYFLRMVRACMDYDDVPERFKVRRAPNYDPVSGNKRVDMRKLLALRLLTLNNKKSVRKWVDDARHWMMQQEVSQYDKMLVENLLR